MKSFLSIAIQASKWHVYSSSQSWQTATGTHMPHRITQCYLPPGRSDIPGTFKVTLKERGLLLATRRKACWKKLDKWDKFNVYCGHYKIRNREDRSLSLGGWSKALLWGLGFGVPKKLLIYTTLFHQHMWQHNIIFGKIRRNKSSLTSGLGGSVVMQQEALLNSDVLVR